MSEIHATIALNFIITRRYKMKTYKSVVKSLLSDGYKLAVCCGEEGDWLCKATTDYEKVVENVESMDCTSVFVLTGKKGSIINHDVMSIVLDSGNTDNFEDITDFLCGGVVERTINKLEATGKAA